MGATVVTDEFKAYRSLPNHGFDHKTVRHSAGEYDSAGEYVRDMAHTNGIESFWALLKRGYIGIYHYMSAKHLHRIYQRVLLSPQHGESWHNELHQHDD